MRFVVRENSSEQIKLEFGNVGLLEEREKAECPEKTLSEQGRERTAHDKLNPHMTPSPRIEPEP